MIRIVYLIVCLIGTSATDLIAQYTTQGLDLDGDISTWYDQTVGIEHTKILEGSSYHLRGPHLEENEYYESGEWALGIVGFGGQEYRNLDLLYNSYKDELIIRNPVIHFSIAQPLLLNQQRIDYFQVYDRLFVQIREAPYPPRGAGFYERLYDGRSLSFFAKRIKNDYIESGKFLYKEEDRFYLLYDGQYTRYKSKRTIYRMFPEQKAQLRSLGKKLDTRLSRGGENNLLQLLEFCDQLVSEK